MEKRERRERYRHKQGHGGGPRSDNRGSRDNKDRTPDPKPVVQKKVIDHTAIPDPHMFDNLKRETDDIAALNVKKHRDKRQIFSNWSKYEMPPEEQEDESQAIGTDYEMLLQGAQIGAQLQLRSERSWDPRGLPTHSAAFTIDLSVLASALASLPLYLKLGLPPDTFSKEEMEHMERHARFGRELQHEKSAKGGKTEGKERLAIYGSLLEQLMDTSSSEQLAPALPVDSSARKSSEHTFDGEHTPPDENSLDFGMVPSRAAPEAAVLLFQQTEERDEELQSPPASTESSNLGFGLLECAKRQPPATSSEPQEHSAQRESPGKKKSRSGKIKVNKQCSWGQDSNETSLSPNSVTVAAPQYHIHAPVLQSEEVKKSEKSVQPQTLLATADEAAIAILHQVQTDPALKTQVEPPKLLLSAYATKEKPKELPKYKPLPPVQVLREIPSREEKPMPMAVPKEKPARSHREVEAPQRVTRVTPLQEGPKPVIQSKETPKEKTAPTVPSPRKEDDQLDFLLSLKKPVTGQQVMNFAAPTSAMRAAIDEDEPTTVPVPSIVNKKTEDLEDWLDSMLDD